MRLRTPYYNQADDLAFARPRGGDKNPIPLALKVKLRKKTRKDRVSKGK